MTPTMAQRRRRLPLYFLLGIIAALSVWNMYGFEVNMAASSSSSSLAESSLPFKKQNQSVKDVGNPYTSDALRRNPYLGWQPPQIATTSNFSWVDCFAKTATYTGKAPDKDGSNQPLGCLERPSQLGGNNSFRVEMFNETSWVPDVTMLRSMLMYGKDRDGHPYPAQLSKELCRDINEDGDKNATDEHKKCFREAKIEPTGPLNASTVTISPWNHFGVPEGNETSITVPAPKVMCMIYTVQKSHSTNIRAIRDTWAGGCDGFLAFSSSPDPRLPAIALQQKGIESYDNMFQKVSTPLVSSFLFTMLSHLPLPSLSLFCSRCSLD